jgi:transposase-like protein/IS1 family transposase
MTCHYCQATAKKFGKFGPKKIQRYRCLQCGKTFSQAQDKPLDGMYTSLEKATQILNLLVEGVGINATSRIADVNKETVLKVLVLAGQRCEKLLDSRLRNLRVADIQCDEIWSFVRVKEKHIKPWDNPAFTGDQYTYVAMDPTSKLVITFAVGKRNIPTTEEFIADLSKRIVSYTQVSTDAFGAYQNAERRRRGGS